jgi:hypothetical protein
VVCFNTIEDQIVPERSSPDAEMLVSFDDRKRARETTQLPNSNRQFRDEGSSPERVIRRYVFLDECQVLARIRSQGDPHA